jgi:hypothetical protein
MGGACRTYGGEDNCVLGFGRAPEVNREFGRSRHRWYYNTKINLKGKYYEGVY